MPSMRTARWFRVTLFNLLIAACAGAVLRLAFVTELSWIDYTNLLHGHSHVALLGWGYLVLYVLFIHHFVAVQAQARFSRLFWATEFSVIGMMISFPLLGYHPVSITFSTLHVLLSYMFVWRIWPHVRLNQGAQRRSLRFAQVALIFMVLSTLALWAMGPLMAFKQQGTALYHATIQFFLHFQLNGWFVFGVLALFFRWLESHEITLDKGLQRWFLWLLVISGVLTYVLAVTWSTPVQILFYINGAGVITQLAALLVFLRLGRPALLAISTTSFNRVRWLIIVGLICFAVKIIVQTAVVIPYVATIAYTIRNYVIAFIHLLLLGMLTHLVLGLAGAAGLLGSNRVQGILGVALLIAGFALTEALLVLQGTLFWAGVGFIPYYYELLFIISLLLPTAILLLLGAMHARVRES